MFTTVQDLGRYGYQQFGVPVAGAMDEFALRAANLLVGNAEDEAGLEVTLLGPTLELLEDAVVAITGGDLEATANGVPLPLWESVELKKGAQIAFGRPRSGARAYIAVAGGIDVPKIMGSKSTYVRGKFGGFHGRVLERGDEIPVGRISVPTPGRKLPAHLRPVQARVARVILGPQDDHFTPESIQVFLSSEYRISPVSDRMGYRLEGPKLKHRGGPDIISDAIPPGAIQVPGHGTPIVMLADRQTTGGYAKIATVISADLRVLAQLRPGDTVSFKAVSMAEAVAALQEQETVLEAIRRQAGRLVERGLHPRVSPRAEGLLVASSHFWELLTVVEALAGISTGEAIYHREGLKVEVRR
jgi:biotin-dependent carboxylase-like uncharacterized protein